jgi:hypothetical protein
MIRKSPEAAQKYQFLQDAVKGPTLDQMMIWTQASKDCEEFMVMAINNNIDEGKMEEICSNCKSTMEKLPGLI